MDHNTKRPLVIMIALDRINKQKTATFTVTLHPKFYEAGVGSKNCRSTSTMVWYTLFLCDKAMALGVSGS